MPLNKNFQYRIEILDELLGSLLRRTPAQLIDELNMRLEEKGIASVAQRTFYNDLKYLIEEKGAPLHRATKADPCLYYTERFSLRDIPISEEDVSYLRQAIDILRKATDVKVVSEVESIITRLENRVHTNVSDNRTLIAFEEHTRSLGQEFIDPIFTAIRERSVLKVTYQPFKKESREWTLSPYLLKEYRNRWFLIGRCMHTPNAVTNLALDRILRIRNSSEPFVDNDLFDSEAYYRHLVGVTMPSDAVLEDIQIKVAAQGADYVRTKPIHELQRIEKTYVDGSLLIRLPLYINYELKTYLLSYGPRIEVRKPAHLRAELKALLEEALSFY
ncbi:MAG: WYL domain-containing protein [Moraxellaceae bacterium]|nr:MAG: WYL domain-containing protein [Moraxellaceae bacterium]